MPDLRGAVADLLPLYQSSKVLGQVLTTWPYVDSIKGPHWREERRVWRQHHVPLEFPVAWVAHNSV